MRSCDWGQARLALAWVLLAGISAWGQSVPTGADQDAELGHYLVQMRRSLADPERPVAERVGLAIEAAATLDRAAMAATTIELRRYRWETAADLLDRFGSEHDQLPRRAELALQAAVYRWAVARSWLDQAQLKPRDEAARRQAQALLEQSVATLTALAAVEGADAFIAGSTRLRAARAIADRALLDPMGSDARAKRSREALTLIERDPALPEALRPAAAVLRAELWLDLKEAQKADQAIQAVVARPGVDPSDPRWLGIESRVQAALGRMDVALDQIERSGLPAPLADCLRLGAYLERARFAEGDEAADAQGRAIRAARPLIDRDEAQASLALAELARVIQCPATLPTAEDAATLAQAHERVGQADQAACCWKLAARLHETQGDPTAAAEARYRGAVFLAQTGQIAEARACLAPIIGGDAEAAPRPRAVLLDAALLGTLAAGQGSIPAWQAYLDTLDHAIDELGNAPEAHEARWLLALALADQGSGERAIEQARAIPQGHPRWVAAKKLIARVEIDRIEDTAAAAPGAIEGIKQELTRCGQQSSDLADQVEFELQIVQLLLSPAVLDVRAAQSRLDALERRPLLPDQRVRFDLARILLNVLRGPYNDAENEATAVAAAGSDAATPGDALSLYDHWAIRTDEDVLRRRLGSVMVRLIEPRLESADSPAPPPAEQWRLRNLLARAYHYKVDEPRAMATLRALQMPAPGVPIDAIRSLELAGTEQILGETGQTRPRLLALGRQLPSGHPLWYQTRQLLIELYLEAGELDEAGRLLRATRLLHPDLGGPDFSPGFERLRVRLDAARARER